MSNKIGAKKVLSLLSSRNLPSWVVESWLKHDTTRANPILIAYAAVISFRVRLSIALLCLICFASDLVFSGAIRRYLGDDATGALTIALMFSVIVTAFTMDLKVNRFRNEGFGADMSHLLDLLVWHPNDLHWFDADDTERCVREALIKYAMKVLRCGKAVGVTLDDQTTLEGDDEAEKLEVARHEFKTAFEAARQFGLTDPNGWNSYFDEAKRLLAIESVEETAQSEKAIPAAAMLQQ